MHLRNNYIVFNEVEEPIMNPNRQIEMNRFQIKCVFEVSG